MTAKHNQHLAGIIKDFNSLVTKKYKKGQREHGGSLWLKKDLIDMAIEEAADQVVYLLTLKQQIKDKTLYTVNKTDK